MGARCGAVASRPASLTCSGWAGRVALRMSMAGVSGEQHHAMTMMKKGVNPAHTTLYCSGRCGGTVSRASPSEELAAAETGRGGGVYRGSIWRSHTRAVGAADPGPSYYARAAYRTA